MKKTTLMGDVLFDQTFNNVDGSLTHVVIVKEPPKKFQCNECEFITNYCDVLDQHKKYKHSTISASDRPMPKCSICDKYMSFNKKQWVCPDNCKK
jgi:hypothetical protein